MSGLRQHRGLHRIEPKSPAMPHTPKPLPIPAERLRALAQRHGTPLWVYDAITIRERIAALKVFDTVRFAQKANSNIHLLRLMREQGVVVDAVSLGEIERALAAGYRGGRHQPAGAASEIVFTADLLDAATLAKVVEQAIPVNAGSIDMLRQLGQVNPGHAVWLRINPGFGHGHSNKTNTGGEHSKHGIWHTDLPAALAVIRRHGLKLVGLHMHIGSGVDYSHLQQVCQAMVALAARAAGRSAGHLRRRRTVDPLPGGRPRIDTAHYHGLWDAARREIAAASRPRLHLEIEPGRYLVAESGLLLAEVRATKDVGANHFALVDAGFNELMRPSMYGAHHGISLLRGRRPPAADAPTVVAGPLCESGDVFTQGEGGVVLPRDLPQARGGRPAGVPRRRGLRRACQHVQQLQQPAADCRGAGRRRQLESA
jgi:diaminopimelate decarboxylase